MSSKAEADARRAGFYQGWTRQPIDCPYGTDQLPMRWAWLAGYNDGLERPAVTVAELRAALDRLAEHHQGN